MARELTIKITADGSQAKSALTDVERGIGSVTQNTETMAKSMQAALGILTAQNIRQFVGDLKAAASQFVDAFSEQERATKSLTVALQAQGTFTPALAKQYEVLSTQFENTTVFSDELIQSMESLFIQVGNVGPTQMKGALKAATDLAAGLGIDLRTATILVSKAFEGHTETLGRYGIILDQTKIKADPIAAVLEGINQKFGGQAQGQLETYSGQMQHLGNEMNNVEERAGGALVRGIAPLLQAFDSMPQSLQTTALGFIAVGGALAPAVLSFSTLLPGLKILIGALPGLAGGTGLLATAMGLLGPAVAIVATAWASWKVGTWIGDITGLTDAVGRLTARLMGVPAATYDAMRSAQQMQQAKLDAGIVGSRTADIDLDRATGPASDGLSPMFALSDKVSASLVKADEAEQRAAELLRESQEIAAQIRDTKLVLAHQTQDFLSAQLNLARSMGSPQLLQSIAPLQDSQAAGLLANPGNAPGAGVQTQQKSDSAIIGALVQGQQLGAQLKAGFSEGVNALPQVILAAIQGGGSVIGSIFSKLGGDVASTLSGTVSKGLGALLPKGLATSIGSLMGPLGAALGPMIGALVSKLGGAVWHGIQGIFGTDEEARLVNPARDTFMQQFVTQFGGNRNDATIKALEAAGLGGERAATLMSQLNAADTMTEFTAAKTAIETALASTNKGVENVTSSTQDLNLQLTGSDDAIKQLGITQDKVVAAMLHGFDQLLAKLEDFIGRLGDAGKLAAAVGVISGVTASPAAADVPNYSTPGEFLGTASDIVQPTPEVMHAGGMVWRKAHSGLNLAPDEVPIIAQTGERVLNRAETKAYNTGGRGSVALHVQPGAIVVNGAGKNAAQIADELVPHLMTRIYRYNTGGARTKARRGVS